MDANAVQQEFPQLRDTTYLDHAGATLYSRSHIEAYHKDLLSNVYGNPHSHNPSSQLSTNTTNYVREMILEHFGTCLSSYDVIFTSGCTAALKMVGEMFPWTSRSDTQEQVLYINHDTSTNEVPVDSSASLFCYLDDNHTSVVGIREIAAEKGAQLICIGEECFITVPTAGSEQTVHGTPSLTQPLHLFAYPAQSNFNGRKYPLSWVKDVPHGTVTVPQLQRTSGQWLVLLDAAGYVSTNDLNLSLYPAHFVALSFYKLFGFPSGLGALLVRQDIKDCIRKNYFGGGTVMASMSRSRFAEYRPKIHERYEDGTVSFLDILALKYGFESLQQFRLTMSIISKHTFTLSSHVYNTMVSMIHDNGSPLCLLYHTRDSFTDINKQGGIVTFNLLRKDGSVIGYSEVDRMAQLYDIHLRTGCFCNSGACQKYLNISDKQILENMKAGHSCGDDVDIVNGMPTGCVRISFGYMSTWKDVEIFLRFLRECFQGTPSQLNNERHPVTKEQVHHLPSTSKGIPNNITETEDLSSLGMGIVRRDSILTVTSTDGTTMPKYLLKKILVYPVKSCAGFEVDNWPVCKTGLKWDREWMVIDDRRVCRSQKQVPLMARIKPCVDPHTGTLTLSFNDDSVVPSSIMVSADMDTCEGGPTLPVCNSTVCADSVEGIDCGDTVAEWLSKVLNKPSRLLRKRPDYDRKGKEDTSLSLSNQAQYLTVTMESVAYFHKLIVGSNMDMLSVLPTTSELAIRFRPNFLVGLASPTDTVEPFKEDEWKSIEINGIKLKVIGKCTRCQMICIDQSDGSKNPEVYRSLTANRGSKATFGVYLSQVMFS